MLKSNILSFRGAIIHFVMLAGKGLFAYRLLRPYKAANSCVINYSFLKLSLYDMVSLSPIKSLVAFLYIIKSQPAYP
jgi:hypothetical protein